MFPRKELSSPSERSRTCVTANLPCSRCRYDLQGQPIEGRCPECGLAIETSLHASIDLETIHGEGLPGPRRIAIAAIVLPLAASTWAIGSAILWGTLITMPSGAAGEFASILPLVLDLIAAIAAVCCVIAVLLARQIWIPFLDRFRSALLFAGCFLMAAMPLLHFTSDLTIEAFTPDQWLLVAMIRTGALFAIAVATTHVLGRIGRRGIAYRESGTAIQTTGPLLISIGIGFLVEVVLVAMRLDVIGRSSLESVLLMLGLASSLLVSLGMVYLLFNAIWGTIPLLRRLHRYSDLVTTKASPEDP
jgi:hypothetical protein